MVGNAYYHKRSPRIWTCVRAYFVGTGVPDGPRIGTRVRAYFVGTGVPDGPRIRTRVRAYFVGTGVPDCPHILLTTLHLHGLSRTSAPTDIPGSHIRIRGQSRTPVPTGIYPYLYPNLQGVRCLRTARLTNRLTNFKKLNNPIDKCALRCYNNVNR